MSQPGLIDAVQYLHQLGAVRLRLILIEQVQLTDAVWREVIEHNAGLHITAPFKPDAIERPHGHFNRVSCRAPNKSRHLDN